MDFYYTLNYIVVGDTGVGKSCIILSFLGETFRAEHTTTIGIDFGSKMVSAHSKKFKLLIWDTAGQEAFNSISRSYYRGAAGALLVYDITNKESFLHIKKWMDEIKHYGDAHISFVLVGNKTDLEEKRAVTYEEGADFAKEHEMIFIETSAKSGQNINDAFIKILDKINEKIDKKLVQTKRLQDNHRIDEEPKSKTEILKEKACAC